MRHDGFTLVELLLVLVIVSLFTLLGLRISTAALHKQYENHFFTTLTQDVRYAQNLSMNNKTADVRIHFNPTSYRVVSEQKGFTSITRDLPNGWTIRTSNFTIVSFTATGSLKYSGTVYIDSQHHQFKVVFTLGKGSYYVTEH